MNGNYDKESKAPITDKQDAADHVRVDGVHVEESVSQDTKMQDSAVPEKHNLASSNASQPHEVSLLFPHLKTYSFGKEFDSFCNFWVGWETKKQKWF